MSRIDEAMKRASQAPHAGRGTRGSEASLRLAEDYTLNEYPLEGRGVARAEVTFAPEARTTHEVRISQESRVTPHHAEKRLPTNVLEGESNAQLVISPSCDAVFAEQYRRLAATLHDAQVEKGLKTVMITSAMPKEGKTLTVVNLALTLSESYGRRVLLVDADLRRPSIHELVKIPNDRGLSELLVSNRVEVPFVQVSERLWVLPAGRSEKSPLAGLSSERMRKFLDDVAGRFDWVLLDTPPVGLLPDAQVVGRLAQAVVFVIRAGVTSFAAVDKAVADLGRDCIIGTVLNSADASNLPSAGQYGAYYRKR